MKILVVDDEFGSRMKLKTVFSTCYGVCHEADGGETALNMVEQAYKKSEPYNLVTLDIEMPGLKGTEVVQCIRKFEIKENVDRTNKVTIFMITKHIDTKNVMTSFYKGCEYYFTKPFNVERLHNAMKEIGFEQK